MLLQKVKELENSNRELQLQIQQVRLGQLQQDRQPEPDIKVRKLQE